MSSPCPNCGKSSKCGCHSCIDRTGFDAETQTFDETGDLVICPFCKVASHPDHWLDAEWKEIANRQYPYKRVQRKQTKGFKLPENTVCVNRPTKWGNPFIVGKSVPDIFDEMYSFENYRDCPAYLDNQDHLYYGVRGHVVEDNKAAVKLYTQYLTYLHHKKPSEFAIYLEPLENKNLACFCPIDSPCHADILIQILRSRSFL